MPEDFSQFIIPQQDFSGLYKIGQQLEAKQAAKVKAAKEAADKKAATSALISKDLELKDFLTGTVEDQIISRDIGRVQQKADLLANAGYDYNHIRMGIADDIVKLRTAAENIKYAETQRKLGLENIKGKKGYKPDEYNRAFIKKNYLNSDGKAREDYWNIDTSVDFDAEVKKSPNIYNLDEAVGEDIKNMGKSSEVRDVKTRDIKGNVKEVKKKIQTSSSFVPDIDEQGVFQGVVPEHTIAPTTDATASISQYISGDAKKPLRMVSDNEFNRMRYNPAVMGGINAETQKYAESIGRVPTPEEIIAFQKAKLYDIYANNAKVGFVHEDVEVKQAPITKNYLSIRGAGTTGTETRDLFTPAVEIYKERQKKAGKSDIYIPMNAEELDTDFVNIIIDKVQKSYGKTSLGDDYNANNLTLKLNKSGNAWEVYETKKDGTVLKLKSTVPSTSLGLPAQTGVKAKTQFLREEKSSTGKSKSIPSIKSYDDATQKKIYSFMSTNELSESDAIQILIKKGLIDKK